MYCFIGGEALSRAEPPAGPPKLDLLFADATFPKNSVIFDIMPGPLLVEGFFLKRIDGHDTYIPG